MLNNFKNKLLWILYYRYKPIAYRDEEGTYSFLQKVLMVFNFTYTKVFGKYWSMNRIKDKVEYDCDTISEIIFSKLSSDDPCMIARYGLAEMYIVANSLAIRSKHRNFIRVITGQDFYWWWNKPSKEAIYKNAGFFPKHDDTLLHKFSDLMVSISNDADVLLASTGLEPFFIKNNANVVLTGLQEAEPWWSINPWTRVLSDKKVVVVSPLAELIEKQYKKNNLLFKNKNTLPNFHIRTVKAIQSLGGVNSQFENWFDALDWMEAEIFKEDFDIALIGCGAYGYPLAAYVKRKGKKAFHMGGVLQMLFGIKGARWEDKSYHPKFDYTKLFNEAWVKPGDKYKPIIAKEVENGCYW